MTDCVSCKGVLTHNIAEVWVGSHGQESTDQVSILQFACKNECSLSTLQGELTDKLILPI